MYLFLMPLGAVEGGCALSILYIYIFTFFMHGSRANCFVGVTGEEERKEERERRKDEKRGRERKSEGKGLTVFTQFVFLVVLFHY